MGDTSITARGISDQYSRFDFNAAPDQGGHSLTVASHHAVLLSPTSSLSDFSGRVGLMWATSPSATLLNILTHPGAKATGHSPTNVDTVSELITSKLAVDRKRFALNRVPYSQRKENYYRTLVKEVIQEYHGLLTLVYRRWSNSPSGGPYRSRTYENTVSSIWKDSLETLIGFEQLRPDEHFLRGETVNLLCEVLAQTRLSERPKFYRELFLEITAQKALS